MGASIIIHGGIRQIENIDSGVHGLRDTLRDIVADGFAVLDKDGARAAVIAAVSALEDCELFNAGTGSKLQADGEIRMSAALMDGNNNTFSGVINIQYVKNPIQVAARLAGDTHTVLAGGPATRYARRAGFPSHFPYTEHRMREHAAGETGRAGTVGAVAVDDGGALFAATSTGGTGGETPGRVSDSATVAGNYATADVGISCTGVGEQIVNLCVAARIAVLEAEGRSLRDAVALTIAEGRRLGYDFGLIALDSDGATVVDQTQGQTLWAAANRREVRSFGE